MTGKNKIPFPNKDPRYHKVWYEIHKKGKTLKEALETVNTAKPEVKPKKTDPHVASMPQTIEMKPEKKQEVDYDPYGIVIMILDVTYLIHEDLKLVHEDLKDIRKLLGRK